MEITLEKIELVKDRTGVSYKEAKDALEAAEGSVVDAIIAIEETVDFKKSTKVNDFAQETVEKVKELIKKGNVSKIAVKRDDEVLVNIPLNVGIVGAVVAPLGLLAAAIAAFGFKCKVEVVMDDGKVVNVTEKVDAAADTVKEKGAVIVEGVKEKAPESFAEFKEKSGEFFDKAKYKGEDIYETAREKSIDFVGDVKEKAPEIWQSAKEKGGDIFEQAKDKGGEIFEQAKDKGGDFFETAKEKSGEFFETAKEKGGDFVEDVKEKAPEIWQNVKEKTPDTWEDVKGMAQEKFNEFKNRTKDGDLLDDLDEDVEITMEVGDIDIDEEDK